MNFKAHILWLSVLYSEYNWAWLSDVQIVVHPWNQELAWWIRDLFCIFWTESHKAFARDARKAQINCRSDDHFLMFCNVLRSFVKFCNFFCNFLEDRQTERPTDLGIKAPSRSLKISMKVLTFIFTAPKCLQNILA